MRLLGDDVDLRERVAAAHVVGRGDARDPVAEHDDALDRAVVREAAIRASDGLPGFSGSSDIVTGPCDARAAGHARVVGQAEPLERRALVVGDRRRFSIPSLTQTGSAPHTPIRQPDSIGSPPASAASSSVMPGLATTRLPSGSNVTSGAPA